MRGREWVMKGQNWVLMGGDGWAELGGDEGKVTW